MRLFAESGVHILADGQYGSCGKGALAYWLAKRALEDGVRFDSVITNAGPNSGHTFYHDGVKHVLKQLPSFAVASHLMGESIKVYFSAGAIIDPYILKQEIARYPDIEVLIHENAAVVDERHKQAEHDIGSIAAVAGTRSGTGAALIAKIAREEDAVVKGTWLAEEFDTYHYIGGEFSTHRVFMEVSQGFSLGINSRFYPKATSRECTFMQAMADARVPPTAYKRGYLAFRTFPIRVGNVDGYSSGDWYEDQAETSWDVLGQRPEITTVTGRERRVATWSWAQFADAMDANQPTHVFINFMNYLRKDQQAAFVTAHEYARLRREEEYELLFGFGPTVADILEHSNTGEL